MSSMDVLYETVGALVREYGYTAVLEAVKMQRYMYQDNRRVALIQSLQPNMIKKMQRLMEMEQQILATGKVNAKALSEKYAISIHTIHKESRHMHVLLGDDKEEYMGAQGRWLERWEDQKQALSEALKRKGER